MRIEGFIFVFMAAFFGAADLVYWFASHDPTGTAVLALATAMAVFVATYLIVTARHIGQRLEDNPDAEISDGTGEIGFFSPYSWAPLWCAAAAAVCFAGVAFGWWMVMLGLGLTIPAVHSMVFEYYED
ncbi:MAG TPA: cytochrome c oxidase subunit 4 [Mycobacteriales bacterium]|nr:cytochrome c oxidase subunit 4 [Mycobacteriales bacterium]